MTLRSRIDRWAKAHSGHPPERNPKVIAVLVVLGSTVLPTATGLQRLPGSLASTGEVALAQASAAVVVLGCAVNVLGLLWPSRKIRDDDGRVTNTTRDVGVGIEMAACFILAAGCAFYATALFMYASVPDRAYAFGVFAGLSIGCLLRAGQIALYVRGRALNSTRPDL